MNKYKAWADSGAVIWATGNDTQTNNLALTIGTGMTGETSAHGYMYDDVNQYTGYDTDGVFVKNTSTDPNIYIKTLQADCIPLYYHSYPGDSAIMGYLYIPPNDNGGSLFFDEFGYVTSFSGNHPFLKGILKWQLNRAKHRITDSVYNVHTPFGVAIDGDTNGVTNEISDVDTWTGWDNSGVSSRGFDYSRGSPFDKTVYHIKVTTAPSNSVIGTAENTVLLDSTVYSASLWVYLNLSDRENAGRLYVREWYGGGGASNRTLAYLYYYDEDGNSTVIPSNMPQRRWIRLISQNFTTHSSSDWVNLGYNYLYTLDSEYWITAPSIYKKPYAPEFRESTSTGGAALRIPVGDTWNIGDSGSVSVDIWVKSHIYRHDTYIDMIDMRQATNGNRLLILRKIAGDSIPSYIYLRDGATWRAATNVGTYVNIDDWNNFVWTWSTSSGYALYVNGTSILSSGSYNKSNTDYDRLWFSGCDIVRNVTSWNRKITSDEVTKISNRSGSKIKQGSIETGWIEELPAYFTSGISDLSDVSHQPHLAYKRMADSDKNLLSSDFTSFTGDGTNVGDTFLFESITSRDMGDSTTFVSFVTYSPFVTVDPNTSYQFSVWYKCTDKPDGLLYLGVSLYESGDSVILALEPDDTLSSGTISYFVIHDALVSTSLNTTGRWQCLTGCLVPESYASEELNHFHGGDSAWPFISEPGSWSGGITTTWKMPSITAKVKMVIINSSEASPSYSWWALPSIIPINPARIMKDKVGLSYIEENL
jgi:hypothetical protein